MIDDELLKRVKQQSDRDAGDYLQECVPENLARAHEERAARTEVLSHIPRILVDGPIVEIGPAGGWSLLQLQQTFPGREVEAITIDTAEAEHCRKMGVTAHVADMHAMPINLSGRYALVFCMHVLEHSAAPLVALMEMRRILKPEGKLVLVMPEPTGWLHLASVSRHPMRLDTMPQHIFNPGIESVIALVRKAGLVFERYHEALQLSEGVVCYHHRVWVCRPLGPDEPDPWRTREKAARAA